MEPDKKLTITYFENGELKTWVLYVNYGHCHDFCAYKEHIRYLMMNVKVFEISDNKFIFSDRVIGYEFEDIDPTRNEG